MDRQNVLSPPLTMQSGISNREVKSIKFQDFRNNARSPDPRLAMVLYGQAPGSHLASDDHGLNFLGFPREIRDNIYSQLCVKPTFIGADSKFTKPFWRDAMKWRHLDFAIACRKIWEESFHIYLEENSFELFYIRPFLEFVEKIGIRGRRLLREIRWHHHARSRPFIVLRYLRSCIQLRTLDVFARVT